MTLRQTSGFLALCLLASTEWFTADLLPLPLAPIPGLGFRLVLVGLTGLTIYFAGRTHGSVLSVARCGLVSAASLGLIGIPFLLLATAEGKVPSTFGVLVFTGMPILLAVIVASSSADSGLRALPYALLGVAGILFVLPVSFPHGSTAILGSGLVLLAMVSTALGLLWLHRLLDGFPVFPAIGLAGFTNGCLLIVAAAVFGVPQWNLRGMYVEALRCILLDLPEVILLIWLTKFVTPQRLSIRYLVTPLLTVVEGWVVFRTGLNSRTISGIILLGAGAYLLIRVEDATPQTALKLQE